MVLQLKDIYPVLAIDLGLKRIGLAYSADGSIITPMQAILRKNRNQASSAIKAVIAEWSINTIVVGIPMGGSSEDEMRRRVAHFMGLVGFGGDIFYQDESDSSLEAEEMLKGNIRHKRDGRIDSLSAKIILQRWLGQ